MSGKMSGRKVKEPTPIVHAMPYTTDQTFNHKLSNLENAWNSIGRMKTALRDTEHRIESSIRPVYANADNGDFITDSFVPVDRIPRYEISTSTTGLPREHGAIGKVPSKLNKSSRKVSRLDEKYREVIPKYPRSPLRDTNYQEFKNRSPTRRVGFKEHPEFREIESRDDLYSLESNAHRPSSEHESKPYESEYYLTDKSSYMRGFDQRNTNIFPSDSREFYKPGTYNVNNKYRNNLSSGSGSRFSSAFPSQNLDADITDSQAVRDTEIRFLNEDLSPQNRNQRQTKLDFKKSSSAHLHHVDVKVPSGTLYGSKGSSTAVSDFTTYNSYGGERLKKDDSNSTFVLDGERRELDSRASTSSSSSNRKFKSLKELKNSDEGLEKIREKIRQQRLQKSIEGLSKPDQQRIDPLDRLSDRLSPENHAGHVDASSRHQPMSLDTYCLGERQRHEDNEIVSGRNYDIYSADKGTSTPVRKIARAPPGPRYQGFSEVETKIQTPDGKVHKLSEIRKERARRKLEKKKTRIAKEDITSKPNKEKMEKTEVGPKKMTRITGKIHKKDLITVRSWRSGQKATLKELGPAKMPRRTMSPPTRDTDKQLSVSESLEVDRAVAKSNNVPPGSEEHSVSEKEEFIDSLEPAKAKALSDAAKNVLADLDSGSESEDEKKEDNNTGATQKDGKVSKSKKSAGLKRKALKQESERQFPVAKVRHYDSDNVRRYMLQKQAERKKKLLEEKERKKKEDELKKQKLQELYYKQKESAVAKQTRKIKDLPPKTSNETFLKVPSELPKRHPFHEDRSTRSESDKENQHADDSDTSTLTGDSTEERTPHASDREDEIVMKRRLRIPMVNHDTSSDDGSMGVDEIIQKYSKDLPEVTELEHKKQDDRVPLSLGSSAPKYSIPVSAGPSFVPHQSLGHASCRTIMQGTTLPFSSTSQTQRSRLERMQAIKDTARSLQSKIQMETQRLTGEELQRASEINRGHTAASHLCKLPSATAPESIEGNRWAMPRYHDILSDSDNSEYVSRYDRMTGARNKNSVFDSELPGVGNMLDHKQKIERYSVITERGWEEAYRMYNAGLNKSFHPAFSLTTESETYSIEESDLDESLLDSTVTEDSHVGVASRRIRGSLATYDYCAGETKYEEKHPVVGRKPVFELSDVNGDPHSVINIYMRRLKAEQERKAAEEYLSKQVVTPERSPSPSYEDDFIVSAGRSPSKSDRSHEEVSYTGNRLRRDYATHPTRSHSVSHERSLSPKTDDTLDSLSITSDYNTNQNSSPSHAKDSVERDLSLIPSGPSRSVHRDDSIDSDMSSLADDAHREYQRATSPPSRTYPPTLPPGVPHISANALGQRLSAELNYLEGMEESVRQLTDIERTRGVALAQQETVSLAQILKGRQQSHEREMQMLQMKVKQESLEASRQLELARQRAADAAQNAAETIAHVRNESLTSFHESTRKLIDNQAEAAKATAEATRQLAEAKTAAVQHTEALRLRDANQMATETATAAATAAVKASMDQLKQAPWWGQQRRESSKSSVREQSASSYTETFDSLSKSISPKSRSVYTSSISTASRVPYDRSRPDEDSGRSISTESLPSHAKDESSVSAAHARGDHLTESISEDIHTDKEADYSLQFDESMTEDEIEEQSFRMVLPSETHRRRAKRENQADHMSYSSDEVHATDFHFRRSPNSRKVSSYSSSVSSKLHVTDLSTPFSGEESFNKFTTEMVRQFMKEEEIRAHHQASLLKLREKALREKTKAELAWLDQQKRRVKDKGADDAYPQIKKKQRGLLMRLQQEQTEIKRLQEANRVAAEERKLLLLQQQEISRMRQSTQQMKEKLKTSGSPKDESEHDDIKTEDEISLALDDTSIIDKVIETARSKDYKSDSEIYTEVSGKHSVGSKKTAEIKAFNQLKMLKLDKRFLTDREKKLQERRKHAEQLLQWKKRLDREEEEILKIEKQALNVWDHGKVSKEEEDNGKKEATPSGRREREKIKKETLTEKPAKRLTSSPPKSEIETALEIKNESITEDITEKSITEEISSRSRDRGHLRSGSDSSTISEDLLQSKSERGHHRSGSESSVPEDIPSVANGKGHRRSGSESSIAEDIPGQARSESVTEEIPSEVTANKNRQNSSLNETVSVNQSTNGEYSSETFESASTSLPTPPLKRSTPLSKASKLSARSLLSRDASLSPRSLKSPRSPMYPRRRGSESESEDSFSQTHSETASDQSDTEGRIRALADELNRRKIEAERLKREHKKRQKDRMKSKEASLLKQIEAYDNAISQMKQDLQNELEHEPIKSAVKPQIKQPRVAEKKLKKPQEPLKIPDMPPETSTVGRANFQRSESESSKSSVSSFDDGKEANETYTPFSASSHMPTSPQLDDTLRAQPTPSPMKVENEYPPVKSFSVEVLSGRSDSIGKKLEKVQTSDREQSEIVEEVPSISESIESTSADSVKLSEKFSARNIDVTVAPDTMDAKTMPPISIRDEISEKEPFQIPDIPDSGRSVLDSGHSILDATRCVDVISTGRKSVQEESEIQEEIPEDVSQRSETSEKSAKSLLSEKSAKSILSEKSIRSYTVSRTLTEKSDRSHTDSPTYSEDFSESVSSKRSLKYEDEKSVKSDISRKDLGEKVTGKHSIRHEDDKSTKSDIFRKDELERSESIAESIQSEDEVSQHLSMTSDISEKSLNILNLSTKPAEKFDVDQRATDGEGDERTSDLLPIVTKREIEEPEHLKDIHIGDGVLIGGKQPGILKFKGTVLFAPGFWTGVELDKPKGTNDGSKDGVKYFDCQPQFGLFVPPDKVKYLPIKFTIESDQSKSVSHDVSEKSEQTLTGDVQKSEYADDFIAESEKQDSDADKSEQEPMEKMGVPTDIHSERSESIVEEMSVATDSEMDRVIASAALAVEEFDVGTPDDLLNSSGEVTSYADIAAGEPSPRLPLSHKSITLEEHVDIITNSLTEMVMKESLETVSNITSRRMINITAEAIQTDHDVKAVDTRQKKSQTKRTSFLDLLTRSEDDSIDNEVQEELSFEMNEMSEKPAALETIQQKEDLSVPVEGKVDATTNTFIQKLLESTVADMITMRRHQRECFSIAAEETDGGISSEITPSTPPFTPEPYTPPHTPLTPDSEREDDIDRTLNDSGQLDDDIFQNRVMIELSDTPIARPDSPVLGEPASGSQQDNIPITSSLHHGGEMFHDHFNDLWIDDDFGLGRKIPNKPPPPYPGKSPVDQQAHILGGVGMPRQDISKLDLQRLTEELFYAIPHKREEIMSLVNKTIDVYWNLRRYGESWDDVEPPPQYISEDDKSGDIESSSRRVYKQLIFLVTGEIITDIYKEDEEEIPQPWVKPKYIQRRYFKGKNPPTTVDKLKEIVDRHISDILGLSGKRRLKTKRRRVGGRKKKDHVDAILVQELREEEPLWVDYSVDELAVKVQLSDTILESLLVETGNVINAVLERKASFHS